MKEQEKTPCGNSADKEQEKNRSVDRVGKE
jgi:hypothetical protein